MALECIILLLENHGYSIDRDAFELVQMYYNLLPATEKSSYQPTVRAKMFHLIGLVVKVCSTEFKQKPHLVVKLFNHYVSTIKSQVSMKNV